MRILAFVAALCAVCPASAQESIEWAAERKLTKADFQGRVPPQAINSSLSWLHVEAAWECALGDLTATVRATFDPSRSWWRTTYGNVWGSAGDRSSATRAQASARRNVLILDAQLLEHEQLHFDLAEVAARRIRKRFEEFRDGCHEEGGAEAIQAMVAEIDRELQQEQARYDRETRHGVNLRAQEQWKRRVQALLK
jgi:hypothetical protein